MYYAMTQQILEMPDCFKNLEQNIIKILDFGDTKFFNRSQIILGRVYAHTDDGFAILGIL